MCSWDLDESRPYHKPACARRSVGSESILLRSGLGSLRAESAEPGSSIEQKIEHLEKKGEGPPPPQAGPSVATPLCAMKGAMSDVSTFPFIRVDPTESCAKDKIFGSSSRPPGFKHRLSRRESIDTLVVHLHTETGTIRHRQKSILRHRPLGSYNILLPVAGTG